MSTPTMQDDPEAYWNDMAGPRWVAAQAMIDRVLEPVSQAILEAAAVEPGERVIDVGCGSGSLALAVAAAGGRVTGLDISRPFVDHAAARARDLGADVDFVLADAQDHDFGAARFDAALSRFGIMFFRDSTAAFANLAGALNPGGRCVFACWQPIDKNPWITWTADAVADLLPDDMPPTVPGGEDQPGPFRFADRDRVTAVLTGAGFADVDLIGFDRDLRIAGSADDVMALVRQIGPLSRIVDALPPDLAERALARVVARIDELHDGDGMSLGGSWWIVRARVG